MSNPEGVITDGHKWLRIEDRLVQIYWWRREALDTITNAIVRGKTGCDAGDVMSKSIEIRVSAQESELYELVKPVINEQATRMVREVLETI